eukprot:9665328-Lingulodinium_polyedra.AAC.1
MPFWTAKMGKQRRNCHFGPRWGLGRPPALETGMPGGPKMDKFKRTSNQKSEKKRPGGPRGPFGG